MNIQTIPFKDQNNFSGQGKVSTRHTLADVWVVKSSELGLTEDGGTHCRTFLGEDLDVGDTVLGVDLRNINVNNPELDKIAKDKIPDVILVKKLSDEENSDEIRIRKSLSHLEGFPAIEADSSDLQNLLQDLVNISERYWLIDLFFTLYKYIFYEFQRFNSHKFQLSRLAEM